MINPTCSRVRGLSRVPTVTRTIGHVDTMDTMGWFAGVHHEHHGIVPIVSKQARVGAQSPPVGASNVYEVQHAP